ncbi:uncharacterized protein LOC124920603 [Impatiens glandulifera]|uniref:uncharacterized protein LOC124920603 n=1 Tax=Impatiens glandulifera TaxID=253017 RepID=UPI001FB13218|nr:uncharacterized protein LOC124920603 [Impatiens glandulifera]
MSACYLLKINLQKINYSFQCKPTKPNFLISYPFSTKLHQFHHSSSLFLQPLSSRTKLSYNFHVHSSISTPSPPLSKDEAIVQAKTCLSAALEKPLNNPKLPGKLKKLKQPRLRVEIPIVDDSPSSLSNLAFQVFGDIPIKRKGSAVKVLIIWSNPILAEAASKKFDNLSSNLAVENRDLPSVSNNGDSRALNSSDVVVFMLPETSELGLVKIVTERAYPKATVIFNPKWGFEEEGDLKEEKGFVGSFEVVYSFMGLEVRGLLSKRKGVVFKCARDGIISGERWNILMEEEGGGGGMEVVSQLKTRPSIAEVENVLYNVMAINSPITKSAKFLKDMLSNVTGKK